MPKLTSTVTTLALFIATGLLSSCSNNGSSADALASTPTETAVVDTPDANSAESDSTVVAALQKNLRASGFETTVLSAVPTQMHDMYWVTAEDLPMFYTDKSGQYIFQGQVLQVGGSEPIDISANAKAQMAQAKLADVPMEDMIVYPAIGETKAVVYTFTDPDCGYCRKLHSEMKDINQRGIEVRYLAWPRSEQSIPKVEAIWCSDDRQAAMNSAKAGEAITAPSCSNPVQAQTDLGMQLGVRGTPAIFTTSGNQIGGYVPANQLADLAINN